MENAWSTVLAVPADVAAAWCAGVIGDDELVWAHRCALPCPALVILRVDGGAAGMRRLFAFLARRAAGPGGVAGFAMRTRLAAVERVFERFNGRVTFDEGDGDRRWWAPAEPAVSWLRAGGAGAEVKGGEQGERDDGRHDLKA